jgi:hypothetical protein
MELEQSIAAYFPSFICGYLCLSVFTCGFTSLCGKRKKNRGERSIPGCGAGMETLGRVA